MRSILNLFRIFRKEPSYAVIPIEVINHIFEYISLGTSLVLNSYLLDRAYERRETFILELDKLCPDWRLPDKFKIYALLLLILNKWNLFFVLIHQSEEWSEYMISGYFVVSLLRLHGRDDLARKYYLAHKDRIWTLHIRYYYGESIPEKYVYELLFDTRSYSTYDCMPGWVVPRITELARTNRRDVKAKYNLARRNLMQGIVILLEVSDTIALRLLVNTYLYVLQYLIVENPDMLLQLLFQKIDISDIHIATEVLDYLSNSNTPKDWNCILLVKSILGKYPLLSLRFGSDPFLKDLFAGPEEIHERIKMFI